MNEQPKRLIEIDLPIRTISEHARREKSIRHGHIATLHIWWARRPLAACRAITLGALLPDPADPRCPAAFRTDVGKHLAALRDQIGGPERDWDNPLELRAALLEFVGDFSNWSLSTNAPYLQACRALVRAAHKCLGGESERPLVFDPFAGGGAIPFEAMRVGAEAYASDLNPVPVLLNKVLLDYVPRYGRDLSDAVAKWGAWVADEAQQRLSRAFPRDKDGAIPIAFVWARTIVSLDPSGGTHPVEIPLIRSMWLSKKRGGNRALRWKTDKRDKVMTELVDVEFADGRRLKVRRPLLEIFEPKSEKEVPKGTSSGGAATCPVSGFTTSVESVREQLLVRNGGASDARLLAVVSARPNEQGRHFREPAAADHAALRWAVGELDKLRRGPSGDELVPNEELNHIRGFFNVPLYGMKRWGDLFTPRQQLGLVTLSALVRQAGARLKAERGAAFATAVQTCLALALGKQADSNSTLCSWRATSLDIGHTFSRQALPMTWDFAEANVISGSTRDWSNAVEGGLKALTSIDADVTGGQSVQASATRHPLPDDAADALVTDPPYYSAVPYADLSDFFYVWLRRVIAAEHPDLFRERTAPKRDELVSLAHRAAMYREKDNAWFEANMKEACIEARRVLKPTGIGVVVFASKETDAWQAMLNALIDAGWIVTASWPIDTEMSTRLRARNSATLASSIHIVCRPREHVDGSSPIGDWRDVLATLPVRIHEWMPRLAHEGIVGADAIFACLGPALEIYSRYERVEKTSGERVMLSEYLEHVWAAVSREALSMIFDDADTSELESDARVTAIFLWTVMLPAGATDSAKVDDSSEEDDVEEAEEKESGGAGFVIDYDAARKIAQGLGASLEELQSIVAVKGKIARLLPVAERATSLFAKATKQTESAKRAKRSKQASLLAELDTVAGLQGWDQLGVPEAGQTTLDRVHQALLLFASGRGDALKRFLVDGVGKQRRFWKLTQALSALYPPGSDERRWAEGVMSRKKGLGL